ncbi:Solute carrier organic anion transporter family member [Aphelenchoides bicaudatus]|nr:Solute carrier organic anion transporter family member [Aphelenchoides bicaudatus]
MQLDKTVVSFFVLFLIVYFLESIGGFFMTSAVVMIEKQFQIPSKISGLMVSASDFGYIPTVAFVAYLGGKGNRSKWIGAGCMLIAVANIIISASNFLFPVDRINLENAEFERSIERDLRRLPNVNTSFYNHLRPNVRQNIYRTGIRNFFDNCDRFDELNQTNVDCGFVQELLHSNNTATLEDVEHLRVIAGISYGFCDRMLNNLRSMASSTLNAQKLISLIPDAESPLRTRCFKHRSNRLLLLGVGRTMPFSLGLPLIDDNVRKSNLPIYFAGMFFIRILGPVIGMLLGSVTNKFYYTFDAPRGLTPRDPLWAGFLAIGLVLFGPSLGLFCFKAPPPSEEEEKEAEKDPETKEPFIDSETKKKPTKQRFVCNIITSLNTSNYRRSPGLALVDRHVQKTADGQTEKALDFYKTIRTVIKQPIYFCMLFGRIIDVMAFKGFFIFLPKYLEIQFGVPQYQINLYMGVIGIVGFAIGVTTGSLLMKRLKLEGRRAAGWVAICSLAAACLSFLNAGVECRSTLTMLGEMPGNGLNTTQTCASGCFCDNTLYPVCDESGENVFFSPCHAGCGLPNITAFAELDPKETPVFSNCSCANNGNVSREFCEQKDCNFKIKLYFFNMAIGGLFGGLGVTPSMLILLRSVPAEFRSVSLGFNGFLVSLLATLPSPTLWGALIDRFCVLWSTNCDGKGACSLYATDQLRIWMHCIYGALRLFALVFDAFVFYHAKGLKILEEEHEEESENEVEPKEDLKLPEAENHLVSADNPKKNSKQHKRSASREIRLFFDTNEDKPEDGERRPSRQSDYMIGTISDITSNGVI